MAKHALLPLRHPTTDSSLEPSTASVVSPMLDVSTDRYIREGECCRLSGLSRTTRWRLETRGKFPRRRKLSDNAVGWLLSEVLEWRASRPEA